MAGNQPPYPLQVYQQPPPRNAPAGVVVIAILNIIVALLLFLGSLGALLVALAIGTDPEFGDALSFFFLVTGVILFLMAIALIIMAVGLIKLRPWARTISIVLAWIGGILGILTFLSGNPVPLINVVINVIIIWYLGRPHVKAAFYPAPPPMYGQPYG